MTAKLVENLDIDSYHAYGDIKKLGDAAVLSKSMLAVFAKSPAHFHDQFILGNRKPTTRGMEIGNAVHLYALQPELFDKKYYVLELKEDGKEMSRDHRHAVYKAQLEKAAGRIDVQPSEMVEVKDMAAALKKNKFAVELLDQPAKIEASIFFTDPQTGLKMRCRPDQMNDNGILPDLKATGRADDQGIRKISFDLRYDLSVALTARGYKALTGEYPSDYPLIFIETSRPHIVEIRPSFMPFNYGGGAITKSYWQIGEERLSRLLDRYMRCKELNYWPGYNEEPKPMEAPDYEVVKLYTSDEEIEV